VDKTSPLKASVSMPEKSMLSLMARTVQLPQKVDTSSTAPSSQKQMFLTLRMLTKVKMEPLGTLPIPQSMEMVVI